MRLQQLAKLHPGCSFILLWHDPVEIFRNVVRAGRQSRYFQQWGMLSRVIFYQEQMIQQSVALSRKEDRVHHLTYEDLIENPEEVCRSICEFLEIEFDKKMLDPIGADFFEAYHASQNDHLNRSKNNGQQFADELINEPTLKKLQRFRARWSHLNGSGFNNQISITPEPGFIECLYHKLAGAFFYNLDNIKRVLFEFLPLPWLRTYRQMKHWFFFGHRQLPADRLSWSDQFWANSMTILMNGAFLAGIAVVDYYSGFTVSLMLFYLIPPAFLALVVSQRWGTLAAVSAAVVWGAVQCVSSPFMNFSDFHHFGVLAWNTIMRFLVWEIVVLLLGRIRVEIQSVDSKNA